MKETNINTEDQFAKTSNGLFIPNTDQTQGEIMAARLAEALDGEVAGLVHWAKSWPTEGQPALTSADVFDTVLTRARAGLWPQAFASTVYKGVVAALGLKKPKPEAPPNSRPARREAARRAARAQLHVLDPQGQKE